MKVQDTPEFKRGYEWAGETQAPDWNEIYLAGQKTFPEQKHSYKNLVRFAAFVTGAGQRLMEAGVHDAKEGVLSWAKTWERYLALYEEGADPNPPPPPGTGRKVHYMALIWPGPFIMVRTPYPMPRWRDVLKGLTPVVQEHGYHKKDISELDGQLPYPDGPFNEEEMAFAKRLDAAFKGDPDKVPNFWLYDWKNGKFVLVRKPLEA